MTCANADTLATLPRFRDFLIAEGGETLAHLHHLPVGRGADDPSLQLDTEQSRRLMEFIRDTRREAASRSITDAKRFLGRYEGDVRDTFYHCSAGVSIAGIRVDGAISGCTSIRARYDRGNIYRDDFMDVWNNRFAPYRDREWMRHGAWNCRVFKYCRGNGMHLRDETGQLLVCHYKKTVMTYGIWGKERDGTLLPFLLERMEGRSRSSEKSYSTHGQVAVNGCHTTRHDTPLDSRRQGCTVKNTGQPGT